MNFRKWINNEERDKSTLEITLKILGMNTRILLVSAWSLIKLNELEYIIHTYILNTIYEYICYIFKHHKHRIASEFLNISSRYELKIFELTLI